MTNQTTTITGKPITVPVSTRLNIDDLERLKDLADIRGLAVGTLIAEWVTERLNEETRVAEVIKIDPDGRQILFLYLNNPSGVELENIAHDLAQWWESGASLIVFPLNKSDRVRLERISD